MQDEQQADELLVALDAEVRPRRGVVVGARRVAVELLVLLFRDLALGATPEGRGLVRGLELAAVGLHENGVAHEVGVAGHELTKAPELQELFLVVAHVEGDGRAAAVARGGFEGEAVAGIGSPRPRIVVARGAGGDRHAVGDEPRGVEAHAELADEVHVARRALRLRGFEELARPRVRDGAEVLDELVVGHAHARVFDGDGLRVLVGRDADLEGVVVAREVGVGERAELQLVERIGRVRHELAEEHLLVAVERVDDQVEHLAHFGLKAVGLDAVLGGHEAPSCVVKSPRETAAG